MERKIVVCVKKSMLYESNILCDLRQMRKCFL